MNMPEPHTEWAVEVTWVDWKKAGAEGPTSTLGPFFIEERANSFEDAQRRDRDIAATRILTRQATYTEWDSSSEAEPTSEEDRHARLKRFYAETFGRDIDNP